MQDRAVIYARDAQAGTTGCSHEEGHRHCSLEMASNKVYQRKFLAVMESIRWGGGI
jgi:hypothetical protein